MYKLSRVIQAHKRDVRCMDYHQGTLATGGSDKIFNLYSYQAGNHTLLYSSDIFEADIISIKINKRNHQSQKFVALGCRNGDIFIFDRQGNPAIRLSHNSTISSIDFIDGDHIVTGSWDAKAIVWSLSKQKPICEYKEHKHAVCVFYNATNNYVTSGSQDKALNIWDWTNGMKIKRVQNAHGDIIREISDVESSGMIITCSNDETVKIWSGDLQPIQTMLGHTAFVFTVKAARLGFYASAGEDKTLKLWEDEKCVQDLQQPCSIWSVAFDENQDIIVAGSDGFIRSFTTDSSRRADPDVQEIFNKQILESSSKKSGMSEEEIKKLLTTHQMKAIPGKKEGEIRVFRNGMVPEAYMWQNGKWDKIGDVITEGGGSGAMQAEPRYYPGDKYFPAGNYDYVFDVDDESGVPKVIPFNDGDNPMEAAQKYCKREGLTKGYLQQIRKFLIQNSSKISRSAKKTEENVVSTGLLKCTPSTSAIEFNDIKNPQGLIKKIKQFNERAQAKKLNERQMAHIERIVIQLESEKTYHQWKLDFKELDALKKLLTWPKDLRFPVWDMLRAFLKHYQSESLFSGLEAGGDIITQLSIGLETENPQAIYTLILKTLSNILIQNTNKGGMLKHSDFVFTSLLDITKKRADLKSANFLSAIASFLYNFSIAVIEKKLEKEDVIDNFGQILKRRLDLDSDPENRSLLLQAGANILYKYHATVKEKYRFLLNYLQQDQVSADVKVFY